jgi:LmbE family N-acetylglucosaminyl deacetylase
VAEHNSSIHLNAVPIDSLLSMAAHLMHRAISFASPSGIHLLLIIGLFFNGYSIEDLSVLRETSACLWVCRRVPVPIPPCACARTAARCMGEKIPPPMMQRQIFSVFFIPLPTLNLNHHRSKIQFCIMHTKIILLLAALLLAAPRMEAQEPLRIIVFGAHPDDCDINAGGIAALYAAMGHQVKFVSLTNGNKGHHAMKPKQLAARRAKEMQEAARVLGITYSHLDNNDGELMPTLENRKEVIRLICQWKADVVITHRPNDYHPDHRYTSVLVQDAAYMISVPQMTGKSEPLLAAPVFLYMPDRFRKPAPFSPDIVVDVTAVAGKKADAICAHQSQVYEWLPWNGGWANLLPDDPAERRRFVGDRFLQRSRADRFPQASIHNWYDPAQVRSIRYVEAFEICEYGSIPNRERIRQLFPMLP